MKPKFTVEIITDQQPKVSHQRARGYGESAVATTLDARAQEVTITMDGSPVFVVGIDKEGNVHLTNCHGMFEHLFGATMHLKNTRPWKG